MDLYLKVDVLLIKLLDYKAVQEDESQKDNLLTFEQTKYECSPLNSAIYFV